MTRNGRWRSDHAGGPVSVTVPSGWVSRRGRFASMRWGHPRLFRFFVRAHGEIEQYPIYRRVYGLRGESGEFFEQAYPGVTGVSDDTLRAEEPTSGPSSRRAWRNRRSLGLGLLAVVQLGFRRAASSASTR